MKTFFILLFTIGAFFTTEVEAQKAETVTATYMGAEEGKYYFSQGDKTIAFQKIDEKVLQTYNLNDDSLKDQAFNVSFTITEEKDAESGAAIKVLTIVGLEPAK